MVKHAWSVVCGRSITDKASNNISLLEVVEQVTGTGPSPAPGSIVLQMEIVSLWTRKELDSPARGKGRIRLISPTNEELLRHEFDVDLSGTARLRTQGMIGALPIKGSGLYWFAIDLQQEGQEAWTEVTQIPLHVVVEIEERVTTAKAQAGA